MKLYDFFAFTLVFFGLLGLFFKRNKLSTGFATQIIFMGLVILSTRGFRYDYARASFQLCFFILFVSNLFFMFFIATIFRPANEVDHQKKE